MRKLLILLMLAMVRLPMTQAQGLDSLMRVLSEQHGEPPLRT